MVAIDFKKCIKKSKTKIITSIKISVEKTIINYKILN